MYEKHAFLILTHKEINHIYSWAHAFPNAHFYIHMDLKSQIDLKQAEQYENIHIVPERIDIKWAGYSMIEAELSLIAFALQHDQNEFFHLISGDDILLNEPHDWPTDTIFMECIPSKKHRYRMRFNTPHANTTKQRSIVGKLFTLSYKILDKILPTSKEFYFGSQWFSIRKQELILLFNSIEESDLQLFKRKLCPDEHFFQYLVLKNNLLSQISPQGNKRYIVFNSTYQHGSSPVWLNTNQLQEAINTGDWFARKVHPELISEFKTTSR